MSDAGDIEDLLADIEPTVDPVSDRVKGQTGVGGGRCLESLRERVPTSWLRKLDREVLRILEAVIYSRIRVPRQLALLAVVVTVTADRDNSRRHGHGTQRVCQLALDCEYRWVRSTHVYNMKICFYVW